jgi:N-acetylmuramoyl-L-alanine amidase
MNDKPVLTSLSNDETAAATQKNLEIDVIARTIWGEARGEGLAGMQAVAFVILNRVEVAEVNGGYWWGNTILQVCHKPYQFSCWNKTDPNFKKVIAVTESDPFFKLCRQTAQRAVLGFLRDNTNGATHYHERSIMPYWTRGETPTARIGRHIFYRITH